MQEGLFLLSLRNSSAWTVFGIATLTSVIRWRLVAGVAPQAVAGSLLARAPSTERYVGTSPLGPCGDARVSHLGPGAVCCASEPDFTSATARSRVKMSVMSVL